MISDAQLEHWREYAKRDDCRFVPSDIRCLVGDLIRAREKLGECHAGYETLRKELAAAQAERDEAREAYARQSEEASMTLEDRARTLQLALAQGSWDENTKLIAEALREERRVAAEIVRDECSFELGEALARRILSGGSEQDDSGLPTAEDVRGILK